MAGLKVDAVRGPVSFDEMRNPVQNIYVKKVEKKQMFGYDKPELWNTVPDFEIVEKFDGAGTRRGGALPGPDA